MTGNESVREVGKSVGPGHDWIGESWFWTGSSGPDLIMNAAITLLVSKVCQIVRLMAPKTSVAVIG